MLTLSLNNTLLFLSLINIFHITNPFFGEILNILPLFRSWGMKGVSKWKRGLPKEAKVVSLPPNPVSRPNITDYSFMIYF